MNFKECKRCLMNEKISGFVVRHNGYCNFCEGYLNRLNAMNDARARRLNNELDDLIEDIRISSQGKQYDCIVGVSGGLDSSWTLVEVKRLGLRPLAVHMDNGWNSELAQSNISNLVRGLGVDLFTYVIDWAEYRNLMQAFFDSDVLDIELLYDNALASVNYKQANKYGVKYILGGNNSVTEGFPTPPDWNWFKYDGKNIRCIARKYGKIRLKSFPLFTTNKYLYYKIIRGIKWISFPDYVSFNQTEVVRELSRKFNYRPYPYKHYESVFTRFYQGYLLPTKFGIDKRISHLSALVVSGQLDRDSAKELLGQDPYTSSANLEVDRNYFLKKMGWTTDDLDRYLKRPMRLHSSYRSEKKYFYFLYKSFAYAKTLMRSPKI